MRPMYPDRRAAFTLIELLVVIAILALLAAIVASGVTQVRNAEMERSTSHGVVKMQQCLDQMWKAVADQARTDRKQRKMPSQLVAFCDNGDNKQEDRAEALWVYMNLRNEFPQTFAEARAPVPPTGSFNGVVLQPRRTFVNSLPATTTLTPEEQSAVLLYKILSESSSRGVSFDMDSATQGAQKQLGAGLTVATDAWTTPIGFIRFTQTPELNQAAPTAAQINLFDMNDPKRMLWDWNNAARKSQVQLGLGNPAAQQPLTFTYDPTNLAVNPVWNRRPTVVAAGPNKAFENDPLGDTDDIYGFRLMSLGKQGD